MPASYKSRATQQIKTVNQGVNIFDDFISPPGSGNYNGLYFFSSITGTGGVQDEATTPRFNYPGAARLTADISGAAARIQNNWSLAGTSYLDLQTRFYLLLKGTGSESYFYTFGYSTNLSSLSATDQAVIYYDSTVSNNYVCKVTVAGVSTQVVTTTPAAILADTYFRVIITPNIVYFFVNAILIATIVASPATTSSGFIGAGITKTAGSGVPSVVRVDAIAVVESFILPRTFLAQ